MILLLLALGCGPGDRQLYLQASQATPAEAPALCQRIGDAQTRGLCTVEAAEGLASTDPEAASRACSQLRAGLWRDECWFALADALQLVGDDAMELCGRAGRFSSDCADHATGREVLALDLPVAVGQEEALQQRVGQEVRSRLGPGREHIATAVITRILARRLADQPLSAATCGQAPPSACAMAWAFAARERADLRALCQGPMTSEAAMRAGAPGWSGEYDEPIAEAWTGLCRGWLNQRGEQHGSSAR